MRLRLTFAFTLVMAMVLGLTGLLLFARFRSDLDASIGRSLHTRSGEVDTLVRQSGSGLSEDLRRVTGEGDDFAQVLNPRGAVIATTRQIRRPLLGGAELRRAAHSETTSGHAPVHGLEGRIRLRAVPVDTGRRRVIVVVGTTLDERNDSLRSLERLLTTGGVVALALAALAGYAVAAGALRPVDSMRRRAAGISPTASGQRLPVPRSGDEIARLGHTLNEMLARLEAAFARERTFVTDASHELRSPLGVLKAELELALRPGRSPDELRSAIGSAAEESDRLIALAEDLLVLARLDDGRLPIRATGFDVPELLAAVAARFERRANGLGRSVSAQAGAGTRVEGDRARLEQALSNMVENALRHGANEVRLSALTRDGAVELHVTDGGPGFPPGFIERAFERLTRADDARARGGSGLGLAIVAAIAASHRGRARAANLSEGGADVWLELPVRRTDAAPSPLSDG